VAIESAPPDDLTIIEGIGEKISALLQANGINTFTRLATIEPGQIEQLLRQAGFSNIANPATWAEQARLAADGKWDELKALQAELKGGRRK
jgi:predicted flap endonuclease-1-like 5' DNA nuclease